MSPLVTKSKTGYFGVYLSTHVGPRPFQASVRRGGKTVHLGCFATAEEAALSVATTPEAEKMLTRPVAPVAAAPR